MKMINLRDYYPVYTEDTFVEVSDEVAAFFAEDKRRQTNYAQYIRDHKAFYSLDLGDGIEIAALHKPEQPDELLMQAEEKQALERALASLSETQRQRIIAHFIEGKSKTAIAFSEGGQRERCPQDNHTRAFQAQRLSQKVFVSGAEFSGYFLRYVRGQDSLECSLTTS